MHYGENNLRERVNAQSRRVPYARRARAPRAHLDAFALIGPDNWQYGAKPAQQVFADVARAIAHFEPVTIGVKPVDDAAAHCLFKNDQLIDIVEMESDDAWIRDCGPAFVVNDSGDLRAVHFGFNAWGGLHDGLYFPWNQDELVGMKVCDLAHVDRYKPDNFILEEEELVHR